MSLLSFLLGVAIGVIAYPIAMAGTRWVSSRIKNHG